MASALLVPSRQAEDLFAGWWAEIEALGAVPRTLVWDGGNDYSVDPAVIGRRIEVTADLARVRVTCDGRVVADHERCWARHQTITAPAHLAAAQAMRAARRLLAPVPGQDGRRGGRGAGLRARPGQQARLG